MDPEALKNGCPAIIASRLGWGEAAAATGRLGPADPELRRRPQKKVPRVQISNIASGGHSLAVLTRSGKLVFWAQKSRLKKWRNYLSYDSFRIGVLHKVKYLFARGFGQVRDSFPEFCDTVGDLGLPGAIIHTVSR
jgi:hypothetical protein